MPKGTTSFTDLSIFPSSLLKPSPTSGKDPHLQASIKMNLCYRSMKQQIHDIIRSQWSKRHSADANTRIQARNLIQVHVALARNLTSAPEEQAAVHSATNLIAPLYMPIPHAA